MLQRSCSKKSQGFIFYESFSVPGGWQEENCVLESLYRFKVRANVKDSPRLHDFRIAETSESQLLSEIILLHYHQLQNAPSGKRLSTQSH